MRILKLAACAAILAASLSGCATVTGALYSEQDLAQMTARHLGVPASDVMIENRDPTATGTYYNVVLASGERMRCFHDGNMMGLGLSNPPRCGDQINTNPLTGR